MLIEKLSELHRHKASTIEFLTDFQLLIEHALDLADRTHVLFVDASFTTHAMSPESVMQVFRDLQGIEPPTCLMLAIRDEQFELGLPLSEDAESNLAQALDWCQGWLRLQAPTVLPMPAG